MSAPLPLTLLKFRTIDLATDDVRLVCAHYRDTHAISYGPHARCNVESYLRWLASRIDEFPDGHVLAFRGERCVGQLELQVPYGLSIGYVNHFYVAEDFRGHGFGRALQEYAERYFQSWEASAIELHVSPVNQRAIGFYRRMGYKLSRVEPKLWKMTKTLAVRAESGAG